MRKTKLRTRAIQEPVFSVANTYFEGGDNDNGYGDYIFLVKHGQPSHTVQVLYSTGYWHRYGY
jgi:hypothetical protein